MPGADRYRSIAAGLRALNRADDVDAVVLSRAGVSEVVGKPLHSAELAAALSRRLPGRYRIAEQREPHRDGQFAG